MKNLLLPLLIAFALYGCVSYDNLATGIPGDADRVIDREGYALGYIECHGQAAWVVYKLTAAEVLNRAVKRSGKFKLDPEVPAGGIAPEDYRASGYDRGHLAPAADMAWSEKTMRESFYMSNISPQVPCFNRGIWAELEARVRAFAVEEKEIYVVTGPVFPKTPSVSAGAKHITVPTHYYKVIYDLTPPRKMIGFIIPNAKTSRPLRDFAVTVDEVESATGLDFFSLVPAEEQDRLESSITISAWRWNDGRCPAP